MSKLIKAGSDADGKAWGAEQDISDYLDYAHNMRTKSASLFANQKQKYRSFAIIPDIIAIDIMNKYNVDVGDPNNDTQTLAKIRNIIIRDYPKLLTGNIVNKTRG